MTSRLPQGDDVNGIRSGGQKDFAIRRGIVAILLADVLLVLVHEFDVFAVCALLVKDDADEVHTDGRGIPEENIKTCLSFPLLRLSDAILRFGDLHVFAVCISILY